MLWARNLPFYYFVIYIMAGGRRVLFVSRVYKNVINFSKIAEGSHRNFIRKKVCVSYMLCQIFLNFIQANIVCYGGEFLCRGFKT